MVQNPPFPYVLLVDDDETTNHVNKNLLLKGGFATQVEVAQNGADALALLRNITGASGNSQPDLLLLDLKMEGMDGFHFLDECEKLPQSQQARLMILLTSSASFYDLTKLKEYTSVADHLYKPLTKAHLNDFVSRFL